MTARPLKIGDKAPAFSLKSTGGTAVALSQLRGKRVVLYFYPKDDTPGCTKEACSFRDALPRFSAEGVVVLGVSGDDVESHRRFTDKFGLSFSLLSDPNASIAKAYGVYKQKSMYGRTYWGIERTTFLIDEQGRIAKIFPKVRVDGHIDEILKSLSSSASAGDESQSRSVRRSARRSSAQVAAPSR